MFKSVGGSKGKRVDKDKARVLLVRRLRLGDQKSVEGPLELRVENILITLPANSDADEDLTKSPGSCMPTRVSEKLWRNDNADLLQSACTATGT